MCTEAIFHVIKLQSKDLGIQQPFDKIASN